MDSRRGVSRARRNWPMRKSLSRAVAWLLVFCMCMANMNSAAFAAEIASASNAAFAATPSDAVATDSNAMEILMPEETISGEALQEEAARAISEGNEFKFSSEIKVMKDSEGRDEKYDDLFKGYKTFLLFADNGRGGKFMGDNENAYGYIVVRVSEDEYREFEKENGTAKKKKATPSDATDSNALERNWELTGNEDLIFLYVNADDGDMTFSLNIEDLDTEDIVVPSYRELQEIREEEKEEKEEETENPAAQPAEDGNEAGGSGGGSGSGTGSTGGGSGSGDSSAETGGEAGNEDGETSDSGAAGNEGGEIAGSGAAGNENGSAAENGADGNEDGETADSEGAGNEDSSEPDGEGAGNGGEAGTDGEKPDSGSSESDGNEPGEGQDAGGSQSDNGNHENGGQAGGSENENGAGHGTGSDETAGTGGQGGNENAGGHQEDSGSEDVSEKPGNDGGNAGHASGDKGDGGQTGGNAGSGSSDKGNADKGGTGSSDKGNADHTDKGNTGSGSGSSAGGSDKGNGGDSGKGNAGSSGKSGAGSSDTAKLSKSSYSVPLVMGPNPDAGFEAEDELNGIEDFDEWQEMMEEAEEEEEDEEEDDAKEVSIPYEGNSRISMTMLPALTATVKKTEKTKSWFRSLFRSSKVSEIEAVVAAGVMPLAGLGEPEYDEAEHHKKIEPNEDGTYTLTLDVTGMNRVGGGTTTTAVPADIVFVMDVSGSMSFGFEEWWNNNYEKWHASKNAVDQLIDRVKNESDVAVNIAGVLFEGDRIGGNNFRYECVPKKNQKWGWENDAEAAKNMLDYKLTHPNFQGDTYPSKPLEEAINHLKSGSNNSGKNLKFLIYLTDGDPTEEEEKSIDVIKKATGVSDMYFYPVAISGEANSYMEKITDAARGDNEDPHMKVDIDAPYIADNDKAKLEKLFKSITDKIITEITTANAGMDKVVITDTLSQYADFVSDSPSADDFKVTCDGRVLTNTKDYTVTIEGKEITVQFNNELDPGSTYSVSFKVKPSVQAEKEYADNGKRYAPEEQEEPHGDADTGFESSGKSGFYSNDTATLSYTYANAEKTFELEYAKPVLQIIEKSGQFAVKTVVKNNPAGGKAVQQDFIINIDAVGESGETTRQYTSIVLKKDETSPKIVAEDGQRFRISEVVPMEYTNTSIRVLDSENNDVTNEKLAGGILTVQQGDDLIVEIENTFGHKNYFHSSYSLTSKTTGSLEEPFKNESESPAMKAAREQPKTEAAKKKVEIEEEEGETLV